MPTLRLKFQGEPVGQQVRVNMTRNVARVRLAARRAMGSAAKLIEARGAADIAAAGNFGPRWTTGLHARVSEGGGFIVINVTHDVPYFMVHQRGALIKGKPLLAIPMSFAKDAQGVWARDFPGGLFRVDRVSGGAPLLLSRRTGEVKYFLRDHVRIPKRFHVIEIARDVMSGLRNMYRQEFQAATSGK